MLGYVKLGFAMPYYVMLSYVGWGFAMQDEAGGLLLTNTQWVAIKRYYTLAYWPHFIFFLTYELADYTVYITVGYKCL